MDTLLEDGPLLDLRLANLESSVITAMSLIKGHYRFLLNNTGLTVDPLVQHFVQNPDGVLSNNRHFIADTQMEYQPNGDATTEGQSLHVIGHCYAYLATRDRAYLDAAILHFDAYLKYFYVDQPIPVSPQRWICNWICNGKEPSLSNWPINEHEPTQGGYKSVPLRFVNGRAQIPHGAPFWGEYLDVVTFAHRGHMVWEAINASVAPIADPIDWDAVYDSHRVVTMPEDPCNSLSWIDWPGYLGKPSYTVDWNADYLPSYGVEWMAAWTGNRIGIFRGPNDQLWDGEILESGLNASEFGTIQLSDISVNGVYLVNYAVRLPEEHGGYRFKRNEVWHNRPINTPLLGSTNQMGNASDAEQWFADACYLLWRITGENRYKKAMDSVLFTCHEYTLIDSTDKFFRTSTSASTPFTDGISYDFTYPYGVGVTYSRTPAGNIKASVSDAVQLSLEQQSVWFRLSQSSLIRTTFGGLGKSGAPVSAKIQLVISLDKNEANGKTWGATLPKSTASEVFRYDLAISDLARLEKDDGSPYLLADARSVTVYGTCTAAEKFEVGVLDSRSATVIEAAFADSDGGLIIGAWLYDGKVMTVQQITYRSDAEFDLRITDDNGWNWYWLLPNTAGAWVTHNFDPAALILSGWQPNHPNDPAPESAVFYALDQIKVVLENSADVGKIFAYYCLNDVPPTYSLDDGYTLKYRVTLQGAEAFDAYLGDCTVINFRDDSLAYTPGVIPFSNIYDEGTDQVGAWHGMPYPGYQYPFIFCFDLDAYGRQLTNVVDFLYDAQQWYAGHIGELGPVAPAYIWNRWDNYKYGEPDAFTPYHWGDGTPWAGYQPRAFFGGARAWYELALSNKHTPPKLIKYVENWINWLIGFVGASGGVFPTEFPSNSPAQPVPDDFTGHMSGLWLAGSCMAYMAGCRVSGLEDLIEACVTELQKNYVVTDIPGNPMNGSWSPAIRLGTDNGMFFGFWSGEVMRGLGLYILYKTTRPGEDIFAQVPQ